LTIAVAGGIGMTACSEAAPSTDGGAAPPTEAESSSQSQAASPSVSADPAATEAADGEWIEAASFGEEGAIIDARHAVWGSGGYLVFGERWQPGEGGANLEELFLWRSADGTEWEAAPVPPALAEAPLGTTAREILTTPDRGYVMYFDRRVDAAADPQPVVLHSPDGNEWEEVDSGLADAMSIASVAQGQVGYVLLGVSSATETSSLWLSEDGLTWELVHELPPGRYLTFSRVAAGDEGFVLHGRRATAEGEAGDPFTLASGDGREWIETPEPFGPDEPNFAPVVRIENLGPDWVAVFSSLDDSARFWFSADGLTWEEASRLDDLDTTRGWDPVLLELNEELYFSKTGGDRYALEEGAWMSADAVTWEPIDLGEGARVTDIASGDPVIVLIGARTDESGQSSAATIWTHPARDELPDG
jgi:hypothetical protein